MGQHHFQNLTIFHYRVVLTDIAEGNELKLLMKSLK